MPFGYAFLNLLSRWVPAAAILKSPFEGMSASPQYKLPRNVHWFKTAWNRDEHRRMDNLIIGLILQKVK